MGIAPACEDEEEAADPVAELLAAVAVPVPELVAAVVVTDALEAFLEPHSSLMLVVQLAWPVALPTFAVMQFWNACSQMY